MCFRYPAGDHAKKRYDGVGVLKWNLEVEPFIAQ
jgi:hypothetical protein